MKLLTVVGARPQFVKAAMVSRAIPAFNEGGQDGTRICEVLVHTGQHYDADMSAVFFEELKLPSPDYHLEIGSGPHGRQTGRMLEALEAVMEKEKPDYVVVYGDTNSTLAAGLAACKLHIPVAHVEAGLRSFNRAMPEEINRVVVDHLSTLLFCPTDHAVKNLGCEGVVNGVHLVGDVMAEALQIGLPQACKRSTILTRLSLVPKRYVLATVHRAENTDHKGNLEQIVLALTRLNTTVVFPCHPRTRKMLAQFGLDSALAHSSVRVMEPVSYLDMLCLESEAEMILTDSGGVQKEAYWLEVPCVTLRTETEWVETAEEGWNLLAGSHTGSILEAVRKHYETRGRLPRPDRGRKCEASRLVLNVLVSDWASRQAST